VCGRVHRHNLRIWGNERPLAYRKHERDSPKVNVWCALKHGGVLGPFFFAEQTVVVTQLP
jgi:hypothetical protein